MVYALHGMMGHQKDWESLDLGLQAVNLWEEGASDHLGFEDWAQSFNGRVDGGKGSILIGYSMGGRLAMHAMLSQPNPWKGVVLISAHPGLENEAERLNRLEADQQWAKRVREMPWSDLLNLWNEQDTLISGSGSKYQVELKGDRESLASAFERWSLGCQNDLRRALAKCDTPVLWITGEQDEKFTLLAEEVGKANDNIEHRVIPEAGHRLLYERESSLNLMKNLIVDFQKRIL